MTRLRDATAALETVVNDTLGDEITYTPAGGEPLTFNAWVEFENALLHASGSAGRARRRVVEVPKAKVAAVNKEDDRISIAIVAGVTFKPADVEEGEGGNTWRVTLSQVRDA
jgi:hypothetical protein